MNRRRQQRAALVLIREPYHEHREWALLLDYCAKHAMVAVSISRDPLAGIALVGDGLADVILAGAPDLPHRLLLHTEVPVVLLRSAPGRPSAAVTLIRDMLARGGSAAIVAQLLDVPLREVEAVAGGSPRRHYSHEPALRPRRVGDPAVALRGAR